ncbi:uncharacterized protein M6B38_149030 [Iris pallida]|uniref:CCHC-type domain-containing protein n=1 Tax=Iris pallida TaxID=29817 RepID=A0AAX6F8H0_IRIPA|nr:uncharacterized protein M6B38_149030 [Iris pallida]
MESSATGHSATGPTGGSSRVTYRPAIDVDGRKVVIFSTTDMEALTTPCGLDLIRKFARRRLPIEAIKKDLASKGFRGLIEVKAIDDRHVLIRPNDESDFLRLRSMDCWFVGRVSMVIFRSSVDFSPMREDPRVPIWIAFPGLPHCMFDTNAVLSIASGLGTLLYTDRATASFSRPGVARVLVEVDVSKPLQHEVFFQLSDGVRSQPVVYERTPLYCVACGLHGHVESDCGRPQGAKPAVDVEDRPPVSDDPSSGVTLEEVGPV